jgi:hypothetical protein
MCEWKHNDKTWAKWKHLVYQFKGPPQSVKVTRSLTRRREKEMTPERDSAKKERNKKKQTNPSPTKRRLTKNPQWRQGSEWVFYFCVWHKTDKWTAKGQHGQWPTLSDPKKMKGQCRKQTADDHNNLFLIYVLGISLELRNVGCQRVLLK